MFVFHLIVRKVLQAVLTLAIIITLVFFVIRYLPGTPFDEEVPEHLKSQLTEVYGLNQSQLKQFQNYLGRLAGGYLGESMTHNNLTVESALKREGRLSFELGSWALLWSLGLGFLVGILSLIGSPGFQRGLDFILSLLLSVPSFVVASLLIWLFCFKFSVFPVALWLSTQHKILPVICAGIRPFCLVVKILRNMGSEAIKSPLSAALIAKGVSPLRLVSRHIAPIAVQPLIPILGTLITELLTGSLIVELIFGLSGLGGVFLRAVEERDYNFVCGLTLVFAVILVLTNQFFEILRQLLDPRLRNEAKELG